MLILLPYTGSTSSSCDIRQRNHWSCHSPFTKFGTSISWEVKRHTVRHTDSFRGNYLKRKITLASYQTYSVEMLNWLVPCPWGRFLADGRGNVSWSPDLFRGIVPRFWRGARPLLTKYGAVGELKSGHGDGELWGVALQVLPPPPKSPRTDKSKENGKVSGNKSTPPPVAKRKPAPISPKYSLYQSKMLYIVG